MRTVLVHAGRVSRLLVEFWKCAASDNKEPRDPQMTVREQGRAGLQLQAWAGTGLAPEFIYDAARLACQNEASVMPEPLQTLLYMHRKMTNVSSPPTPKLQSCFCT